MTAFPTYSTGTVAIGTSATAVVGTGSNWTGVNAMPGDLLVVGGNTVIVQDVTDATHLVIDAWPYTAITAGTAYKLYKVSPLRFVGAQTSIQVDQLVSALDTNGFYVFVDPAASVPDPSLGQDSQYAFQATTGKLWQKTSGTWNFIGVLKGFGVPAPWSAVTAYNTFDVVSLAGSSYVCILANTNQPPPNATYWTVLAGIGATGPLPLKPIAPWATSTAYVIGPPADFVSINGSSYECLTAHTSGTFATDLAAGKWGLVAQAAPTYGGSSSTSFAIATGSTAFTGVATNLAYQVGNYVRASSAAGGANFMEGPVTAYAGGTLTINVTKVGGSGTHTDWNFSISGAPGTGDLLSTNNLSDVASTATAKQNLGVPAVGQCKLTKSGSNLILLPFGGNLVTINGVQCTVPDVGVTLAPTSLTTNHLYYIFAVATSGVVTSLEAGDAGSVAHATSTTAGNKGVEIKSGDDTRTLVGMARIVSGPAWADSATQRFVVSWFNRKVISLLQAQLDTGASGIATTLGERSSTARCEFLTWPDETVCGWNQAAVRAESVNNTISCRVDFDQATFGPTKALDSTVVGNFFDNSTSFETLLTEGYHFSTWDAGTSTSTARGQVVNMARIRG